MAKGCVLLLSGGIDSALCLAMEARKRNNPICPLFIDYGQPQLNSEVKSMVDLVDWASTWRFGFGVNIHKIADSLYSKNGEVWNRNLIFLAYGANVARGLGFNRVVMGIRNTPRYADCTEGFVEMANALVKVCSGVQLEFPIFWYSKRKVFQDCAKLDVPVHLCHSCIRSNIPCGDCPSCRDIKRWQLRPNREYVLPNYSL